MPDGTAAGPKKETVYSGPAIDNKHLAAGTVYQGPGAVAAPQAAQAPATTQVPPQLRRAANWFYWIAGISLVNIFLAFTHSTTRFVIGLGLTMFRDAASGVVMVLSIGVIGLLGMAGFHANKGHRWAFIFGMVLYGLDGLLLLNAGTSEVINLLFHAYALFAISRGLKYAH